MNASQLASRNGPRRPFPAVSYRPVGRLADLARLAEPCDTPAEIVDFALTARLAGGRLADTWSWGVLKLPSGRRCPVCTTFGAKGLLLLEVAKTVRLMGGGSRGPRLFTDVAGDDGAGLRTRKGAELDA